MNSGRLKALESEVEQLRMDLYKAVKGKRTRLASTNVLPVSKRLDALIIEYHKEKLKIERA